MNLNASIAAANLSIGHIHTTMGASSGLNPITTSATTGYILSQYSNGVRYTYITLLLIILMMIMLGNIALIAIICFYKSLHTTTNVFIMNLALGDMLLAVTVVPFDIDRLLRGYFAFDEKICEVSNTVFFLSLPASTVNLSILTFERFCAVRFPLMHRTGRLFTKKRNIAIIVCAWFYTSITSCLPVMGWRSNPARVDRGQCLFFFEVEFAVFQLIANFIIPLLFIVVMNAWILQIARKGFENGLASRRNSSAGMRKNSRGNGTCKSASTSKRRNLSRKWSGTTQAANNKAAKIISILVGVFVFCWMPYIITIAVNIVCHGCSPVKVTTATMILVFMNSAINPVLYGIYKPQIRSSIKETFTQFCNHINKRRRYESHAAEKELELTCL